MVRYDLRHLHEDFYGKMMELIDTKVKSGEVVIFLFEIFNNGKSNFDAVYKSAELIKDAGHELLNSLKFNEVDWTIVVRKK
jgi:NADH-quinone oxidoreductase subunit E